MCSHITRTVAVIVFAAAIGPTWAALPGQPIDQGLPDQPSVRGLPSQAANNSVNGRRLAEVTADLPPGKVSATLICLRGFQFAVGAILGHGTSASPAVSLVQVYAHSGEKLRPATCAKR